MASRAPMTAAKDAAFTRKQGAIPAVAIITPAMAGPMMRADVKLALFNETALATSSGPTIWITKDWRLGLSTTVTQPSRKASTKIIHSRTVLVTVRTPR